MKHKKDADGLITTGEETGRPEGSMPPIGATIAQWTEMSSIAASGIAVVATESLLAIQLGITDFPSLKTNVRASVYWPEFVGMAKSGQVGEEFLPGALGRLVLDWAETEAA